MVIALNPLPLDPPFIANLHRLIHIRVIMDCCLYGLKNSLLKDIIKGEDGLEMSWKSVVKSNNAAGDAGDKLFNSL